MNLHQIDQGYISSLYFTETGGVDQPPITARLTEAHRLGAYIDCRQVYEAVQDLISDHDASKFGRDLWMARNGGAFDPEVYGSHTDLLNRIARVIGPHYPEFT